MTDSATQIFELYFKNRDHLRSMVKNGSLNATLKANKSIMFVLDHLLSGTLGEVDFELYSREVNTVYQTYLNISEKNKPIHGLFYTEIRQRYYDILGVEGIQNPETPLEDTHLAWMLSELSDDTMSVTKKHRWLGYIQGIMTAKGYLNVNVERDATRSTFNGA